MNNLINKTCNLLLSVVVSFLLSTQSLHAQCPTQTSGILAEWNMNSLSVCSGGISSTEPWFKANFYKYCPNVSAGCGQALLGSRGHANTSYFANAICVLNFYDLTTASNTFGGTSDYDPTSSTFDPNSPANIYTDYTYEQGKGGCIDQFSVLPVQYMYDGSTVNFESMGVAVYRDDFLIHTETQNILPTNVNGTPMTFDFNGSQFCADGSQAVTYRIVFGFVHQLVTGGSQSPAQTGIDDIRISGTCSIPVTIAGAIVPPTCMTAGGANNDGSMYINGFKPSDRYDFTGGNTYTGGASYATATPIPADGLLSTTLVNPIGADTTYTIRVINAEDCYIDYTMNMTQVACSCTSGQPNSELIVATDPTCAGLTANNDGSISITGVVNGDKIGIYAGGPYAGPDYATADVLSGGAFTYNSLPNPVSSQVYTIRIFNGGEDGCFVDRKVEIFEAPCGPCSNASVEIVAMDQEDIDSSPANTDLTEDDIAIYEACRLDGYIDLELSKGVSAASGTTADTYTYTINLSNNGTITAHDIQVAESLPEGTVMQAALFGTLGSTPDNLVITSSNASVGTFGLAQGWLLDSLQAGQTATLTIDLRALIPGTYENCAYVTDMFPDNDPDSTDDNDATANEDDDDCATITVTGSALPTIVKEFSPMLTKPNTPTRLTLKITNTESTDITLTADMIDVFPTSPGQMVVAATPNLVTNLTGLTVNAGDTQLTIPSGTVLPPGLTQIQLDITVPAEGHYCNDVNTDDLVTTAGNNFFATQACLAAYNAYVLAPITGTECVCIDNPGDVVNLTLTIENRNATDMTLDQDFINYLPEGLTMATGSNTGTITTYNINDNYYANSSSSGGSIPANLSGAIETAGSAADNTNSSIINLSNPTATLFFNTTIPAGASITISIAKNNAAGSVSISDGTNSQVYDTGTEDVLEHITFVTGQATNNLTFTRIGGGIWLDGAVYNYTDSGNSVNAFAAGDTSFTLVQGSVIAPGVQTIIVPVTSNEINCYENAIYMNSILVSVGTYSMIGNQDIAESTQCRVSEPTCSPAKCMRVIVTKK